MPTPPRLPADRPMAARSAIATQSPVTPASRGAAGPRPFPPAICHEEAAPAITSSRRHRLWELAHKCHCPIVGTCFEVNDLRRLMARVMHFPRETGDFVLHTTAVGACEKRGPLSELLHKQLEKRYAVTVRRYASARDTPALSALWAEARLSGQDLPAALWATLTHPACNDTLTQEIYGDIHMIQHQIGAGARASLSDLKALRHDNATLQAQLAETRQALDALRREKIASADHLTARVAQLRADLMAREGQLASAREALSCLQADLPALRDREALQQRAREAALRAAESRSEVQRLGAENRRLRELLDQAAALPAPAGHVVESSPTPIPLPPATRPASLGGKCVLCVGGRTGAVDAYRTLVESRGGRFLHHDGGLEESMQRMDGALAAADLVICQAGCISHNAYWRVKERCKRTGKRCIFLKGSGISSFAREIGGAVPPVDAGY